MFQNTEYLYMFGLGMQSEILPSIFLEMQWESLSTSEAHSSCSSLQRWNRISPLSWWSSLQNYLTWSSQQPRYYYYPHFTNEGIKAEWARVTCSSNSQAKCQLTLSVRGWVQIRDFLIATWASVPTFVKWAVEVQNIQCYEFN